MLSKEGKTSVLGCDNSGKIKSNNRARSSIAWKKQSGKGLPCSTPSIREVITVDESILSKSKENCQTGNIKEPSNSTVRPRL